MTSESGFVELAVDAFSGFKLDASIFSDTQLAISAYCRITKVHAITSLFLIYSVLRFNKFADFSFLSGP